MKLKAGPWDGAQPRTHVLKVLRKHGVLVERLDGDMHELVDLEGDPVVVHLPNPVPSEIVIYLWRRFGSLHGFAVTDLRAPKPRLH